MKKIAAWLMLLMLLTLLLTGCGKVPQEDGRLRVVTTLFPYYDFARAIAGDRAQITLLLSPGREAHSFEPTPLDAVTISKADVFVYSGGESEAWVDDMLDAVGGEIGTVLRMMDCVDAIEEEFVEGMQVRELSHDDEDGEGDVEYDEHIWTSPKNAILLCRALCSALCAADSENADAYRANCEAYCLQLAVIDARLTALRVAALRDTLVVADRFPLLYLCRAYDLDYRAAFHGCSSDTEPSLATLRYLIDKVDAEQIPVIYTVDLDSPQIAEAIAECTGAKVRTLWSMQTISRADLDAGETYISLMERNLEALKEGLLS